MTEVARPLEWEEVLTPRGDGQSDVTGWEADCGFESWYEVEMGFGSDSYCWSTYFNCKFIQAFDDPEQAKACAQADFERRVASSVRQLWPAGE